ncbi:MAG TPA: IS1595 family transposase [Candidatus Saccharimonadales bacterium]|nr:IS1595 family transposase [Candidatus Saccharimonadales bacterium]
MNTYFGLGQFLKRFPDDEACLKELLRYPNGITCVKCGVIRRFYKIKSRPAYECAFCGKQIYPLAGTIFHKSSTKLVYWFYAMFITTQTRSGVSAKQLERELGVTYKCAFRIFHQIRKLM